MKCIALDRLRTLLSARAKLQDLPRRAQAEWVASSVSTNRLEILLTESLLEARQFLKDIRELTNDELAMRKQLDAIAAYKEQTNPKN